MKRIILLSIVSIGLMTSGCVSKKKFSQLQEDYQDTKNNLETTATKLSACKEEKSNMKAAYESQIETLKNTNNALINSQDNLATISQKGAENLERSLESLQEKDMQIKTMRDAINKKDSVTLALVTSMKSALSDVNDDDIEISVDKGAVFVSISDKLLFDSGKYSLSKDAKNVLGKVAKVVKDKKDFEFMVEGHTDTDPIATSCISDNWDLSAKRAIAVVRVLQEDYNVDPKRMTAAARSKFIPVASNDNASGKAKNRRTKIIVLPKLDQFFGMIEDSMKDME
ncbi:MAG: OmpA family protein [Psychroflexus sp.]|nr:OmpA family protein [Psychroflexus sp.]